jgi:hypothetical protein
MCFGPVVACLFDLTVTLAGQSVEYWSGNWSAVTEGNPIPHWLLTQHPLALCGGIACWIAIFCTAILRLRPPVARIVAFFVMLGHATAASTWLLQMKPFGILYAGCLLLLLKVFDGHIWRCGDVSRLDADRADSPVSV